MTIVVGVHMNTQAKVDALMFRTPPSSRPLPLAAFAWQPFNKKEYGLSFARKDSLFNDKSMSPLHAVLPSALVLSSFPRSLQLLYYLHLQGSDTIILNGAAVLSHDSLCPPFDGSLTTNIFKCHFGIKFHDNDITPTFDPSHHLSSRCALDSLISCDTNFPSMATGLRLMQAFPL
jgi:hypothetical protein